MTVKDVIDVANGMAGIAALVNSLVLWPVIKSLKSIATDLDHRVTKLEKK